MHRPFWPSMVMIPYCSLPDADTWVKATAGSNKGRLHSFGSMVKATSLLGGPSASYSYTQRDSSFQPNWTLEQFEDMLNTIKKKFFTDGY